MRLQAMIVSRDWQEVSVLECILNSLHVGIDLHQDVARAREKFSKCKFDALIVDRDLAADCLVRKPPTVNQSIPFILISRTAEQHDLPVSGATYFFEKPISVEQAVRTLSATRNLMMAGRMRYHRHELHVPVALRYGARKCITAELTNLSYGGLGIRAAEALNARGPISVHFKVPGLACAVAAKGELAWADSRGYAGIRFIAVPAGLQETVQTWLDRRYFSN